jgi:hypothetical protein
VESRGGNWPATDTPGVAAASRASRMGCRRRRSGSRLDRRRDDRTALAADSDANESGPMNARATAATASQARPCAASFPALRAARRVSAATSALHHDVVVAHRAGHRSRRVARTRRSRRDFAWIIRPSADRFGSDTNENVAPGSRKELPPTAPAAVADPPSSPSVSDHLGPPATSFPIYADMSLGFRPPAASSRGRGITTGLLRLASVAELTSKILDVLSERSKNRRQ